MSTSISAASRPTPESIFNALNGYQETAALKTAMELDLFTAIAEGNNHPAALAKRIGAAASSCLLKPATVVCLSQLI
jgi:hypothetical protein